MCENSPLDDPFEGAKTNTEVIKFILGSNFRRPFPDAVPFTLLDIILARTKTNNADKFFALADARKAVGRIDNGININNFFLMLDREQHTQSAVRVIVNENRTVDVGIYNFSHMSSYGGTDSHELAVRNSNDLVVARAVVACATLDVLNRAEESFSAFELVPEFVVE